MAVERHPTRRLIAGNWKMNGTLADAARWARAAVAAAMSSPNEVVLFPPYPLLATVAPIVSAGGSTVRLGAQACHTEPYGAFTGAVSAAMLAEVGCAYVLCGHSERRRHFAEDDARVAGSVRAAVVAGLVPVLCVGETAEERAAHRTREVVLRQLDAALDALPRPDARFEVAYEPVWAIGTGVHATPEQAAEVHGWIRSRAAERLPKRRDRLRILYGGSVTPANIAGFLSETDVDGALVGGQSLDPAAFASLVHAAPEATLGRRP
jgi:triosephosphate isomerase